MKRLLEIPLLLAGLIFLPAQSLGQSWCAKPSGILAREYGYDSIAPIRDFAQKLAQGRDYIVISKLDPLQIQENISQGSRARAMQAYSRSKDFEETKKEMDAVLKITERNLLKSGAPRSTVKEDAESALLRHLFAGKMPTAIDYHHVFSSKPQLLNEIAGGAASERGVTIEGDPSTSLSLFQVKDVADHPFRRLTEKNDIGLIVLSGVEHPSDFDSLVGKGIPIVRISSSKVALNNAQFAEQAFSKGKSALNGSKVADTVIVNMFPTQTAAAKAWGFDPVKSEKYANAGAAFVKRLKKDGYGDQIVTRKTKQEFVEGLRLDTSKKKSVYIIGEAGPDGAVRIPGLSSTITREDMSGIDLSKVFFISCNSQALGANTAALSFTGKIYTDHADFILKILLPAQPKDDYENSLMVRLADHSVNGVIIAILTELACQVSADRQCLADLTATLPAQPR